MAGPIRVRVGGAGRCSSALVPGRCDREALHASRGVQDVTGEAVAAGVVVPQLLVEHEPVVPELAEVARDRVLGQAEVVRDLADVGLGDEPSLGVERRVEGDVLEDRPGGDADGPLHRAARGEDLGEGLRAADDPAVGQHASVVLAARDDVGRLTGSKSFFVGRGVLRLAQPTPRPRADAPTGGTSMGGPPLPSWLSRGSASVRTAPWVADESRSGGASNLAAHCPSGAGGPHAKDHPPSVVRPPGP